MEKESGRNSFLKKLFMILAIPSICFLALQLSLPAKLKSLQNGRILVQNSSSSKSLSSLQAQFQKMCYSLEEIKVKMDNTEKENLLSLIQQLINFGHRLRMFLCKVLNQLSGEGHKLLTKIQQLKEQLLLEMSDAFEQLSQKASPNASQKINCKTACGLKLEEISNKLTELQGSSLLILKSQLPQGDMFTIFKSHLNWVMGCQGNIFALQQGVKCLFQSSNEKKDKHGFGILIIISKELLQLFQALQEWVMKHSDLVQKVNRFHVEQQRWKQRQRQKAKRERLEAVRGFMHQRLGASQQSRLSLVSYSSSTRSSKGSNHKHDSTKRTVYNSGQQKSTSKIINQGNNHLSQRSHRQKITRDTVDNIRDSTKRHHKKTNTSTSSKARNQTIPISTIMDRWQQQLLQKLDQECGGFKHISYDQDKNSLGDTKKYGLKSKMARLFDGFGDAITHGSKGSGDKPEDLFTFVGRTNTANNMEMIT